VLSDSSSLFVVMVACLAETVVLRGVRVKATSTGKTTALKSLLDVGELKAVC
jgi:hypothetical protein